MRIRKQLVVIGAAGLIGVGAAGAYAASMSVSALGGVGAGAAAAQASCAQNVDVHPDGSPVWNAAEKTWVYNSLRVTGDFSACTDTKGNFYKVEGTVFDVEGAAVLETETHLLYSDEEAFTLDLTPGTWTKDYLEADADNLTFGLIVRSSENSAAS